MIFSSSHFLKICFVLNLRQLDLNEIPNNAAILAYGSTYEALTGLMVKIHHKRKEENFYEKKFTIRHCEIDV